MNKKINIVLLFFNIITCQAMDYYIEPEHEIHTIEQKKASINKTPQEISKIMESEQFLKKNIKKENLPSNITDEQTSIRNKQTSQNISHDVPQSISHEFDLSSNSTNQNEITSHYAGLEEEITLKDEHNTSEKDLFNALDIAKENQMETILNNFLQQALLLPNLNVTSLSDIITSGLKNILFHILQLPKKIQTESTTESFKSELQYLFDEIQNYNTTSVYTNIDQMLIFIQNINDFLKESHLVQLLPEHITNMDNGYTTAKNISNVFKTKNIIFDFNLVPNEVQDFFSSLIKDGENVSKITNSAKIIHAIYGTNGSIDLIIHNWKKFMTSSYTKVENNIYYADFMAFLLIFQDSILATICILNETSQEFKVTHQLSAKSLHHVAEKDSDTNVNNSFNIAVSSD